MGFLTEESRKHIEKKWNRLTSTIWTKLFAGILFIQFCLVILFQSRILVRNDELYNDDNFERLYKCDKMSRDQNPELSTYLFLFSAIQSSVFIFLQLYLIYFGLNAIFHEHVIQIITLAILNVGSAAYTVVQLVEVKLRVDRIQRNRSCLATEEDESISERFNPDLLRVDVPQIITLSIMSMMTVFLAYRLYLQFGWSVYKRIGGDFKIQKIYRNNLIFLMLLKLNLFFWIIYIIPTVIVSIYIFTVELLEKLLISYHIFATLLALILQILAYRSVNRESKRGMVTFTVLWTFIIIDYGLLIYLSATIFISLGSYFVLLFTSVFLVIAVVTFVFAIVVTASFDRGLLEIVESYKHRIKSRPTNINMGHTTLNVPSSSPKHSISTSSTSHQLPPTSPLSPSSDNISKVSDDQRKDETRWTIDD